MTAAKSFGKVSQKFLGKQWENYLNIILASVSFWPLLIIESVAPVSQHVLFTHDLLFKKYNVINAIRFF